MDNPLTKIDRKTAIIAVSVGGVLGGYLLWRNRNKPPSDQTDATIVDPNETGTLYGVPSDSYAGDAGGYYSSPVTTGDPSNAWQDQIDAFKDAQTSALGEFESSFADQFAAFQGAVTDSQTAFQQSVTDTVGSALSTLPPEPTGAVPAAVAPTDLVNAFVAALGAQGSQLSATPNVPSSAAASPNPPVVVSSGPQPTVKKCPSAYPVKQTIGPRKGLCYKDVAKYNGKGPWYFYENGDKVYHGK